MSKIHLVLVDHKAAVCKMNKKISKFAKAQNYAGMLIQLVNLEDHYF